MKPLAGRRLLLTRAVEDNTAWARSLERLGASVTQLPCIEFELLDSAAERLEERVAACDWIAFTSRRGVRAVARLLDASLPPRVRVASVGPATHAEAGRVLGRGDLVASGATARALGDELLALDQRPRRVLVAGAENGLDVLAQTLRAAAVEVDEVAVYRTVPVRPRRSWLDLDALNIDAVLLASPSAARGLAASSAPLHETALVTIGPTTSRALRELGLRAAAEAEVRSLPGLVDVLLRILPPRTPS